jgi:hypothetical protein
MMDPGRISFPATIEFASQAVSYYLLAKMNFDREEFRESYAKLQFG